MSAGVGSPCLCIGKWVIGNSETIQLADQCQCRSHSAAGNLCLDPGNGEPGLGLQVKVIQCTGDQLFGFNFPEAGLRISKDRFTNRDDVIPSGIYFRTGLGLEFCSFSHEREYPLFTGMLHITGSVFLTCPYRDIPTVRLNCLFLHKGEYRKRHPHFVQVHKHAHKVSGMHRDGVVL